MSPQASTNNDEITGLRSKIETARKSTNGPGADTSKLYWMAETFKLSQLVRALTKGNTFDPEKLIGESVTPSRDEISRAIASAEFSSLEDLKCDRHNAETGGGLATDEDGLTRARFTAEATAYRARQLKKMLDELDASEGTTNSGW